MQSLRLQVDSVNYLTAVHLIKRGVNELKSNNQRMTKENIVTLKETRYHKPTELYAVVEKCIICGEKHIHSAEEGYRVAHCNLEHMATYNLVIDRENAENLKLAEKYGIQLDSNNCGDHYVD